MRLALAQLNPLVGDLNGNATRILNACKKSAQQEVDLVLTPELSLWGYPPRDLLLNPAFLAEQDLVLDKLVEEFSNKLSQIKVLIGIVEQAIDNEIPKLFNSIALLDSKGWKVIARKQLLPTYDVFDETRYFRPADSSSTMELECQGRKWKIGLTICEDLWVEEQLQGIKQSGGDPIAQLIPKKLDLLLNLSASPFTHSKETIRNKIAAKAAKRLQCPVIFVNQVGGNDELIFDGSSFVVNEKGNVTFKLANCQEEVGIWDSSFNVKEIITPSMEPMEKLFLALVLGVRDYAIKCGFSTAILGLSGGIDSTLVAIIATAALGADNVNTLLMPAPWSSEGSINDALSLAKRLQIKSQILPIKSLIDCFHSSLTIPLGHSPEGITAENLQARIRGILLMALANQKEHLLLSTGNKSELAVGYCTLYGDMNGGLSVIGDLYKTCVYDLCNWLDSTSALNCLQKIGLQCQENLVGESILNKPPSAELRPGQLDSDSLPDYKTLDQILKSLIEERLPSEELIKRGTDPELVKQIKNLLRKGEFKRRQAPPLLKVSHQAFGSGWRIPIATS